MVGQLYEQLEFNKTFYCLITTKLFSNGCNIYIPKWKLIYLLCTYVNYKVTIAKDMLADDSFCFSAISPIALIGIPSEIYVFGTQYAMIIVSTILSIPFVLYFILPVFCNDLGVSTAHEVCYTVLFFNNWISVLIILVCFSISSWGLVKMWELCRL